MVILYIFILILDILKFLNKSKSKFCWLTGFYVVLIQIECWKQNYNATIMHLKHLLYNFWMNGSRFLLICIAHENPEII